MKKIPFILFYVIIVFSACKQAPKVVTVDLNAEKAAVATLFDKFNSAYNAKNAAGLAAVLTEDALCCGTDPSEFWTKKEITDLWKQFFTDTTIKINYSYDKREIRIASDGNSAIVVDQYIMPFISKITLRNVSNAVKTNGNWMIDFMSWGVIPKNEDIPKLDKAVEWLFSSLETSWNQNKVVVITTNPEFKIRTSLTTSEEGLKTNNILY